MLSQQRGNGFAGHDDDESWEEPTAVEVTMVSKRQFEEFAAKTETKFSMMIFLLVALFSVNIAHLIVVLSH